MNKLVRGFRVTLDEVLNSNGGDAFSSALIEPVKATMLSGNSGTLVQDQSGVLYRVSMGDWFRSAYYLKGMSQVDEFNQLQDLGLTEVKDKVLRHEQEVSSKNSVSIEKIVEAVGSDNGSEEEDQDRSGAVQVPSVQTGDILRKKVNRAHKG